MYQEDRRAQRCNFIATAEVEDSTGLRYARVADLSIYGCYLHMPDPFSKGASVLLKIRTTRKFFQCQVTVVHSTIGIGMGVEFDQVSPPFQIVLQDWLLHAVRGVENLS
jgi:hypothetical protein